MKWEKYMCTLRKHVPSTSVRCEHRKAIYLFQVTPCSSCGTILFRTKPICSKRMRRLVSVRVFYTLGGGYIAYGITHKCGVAFLIVRRTQHVRGMRSSIVSVTYYDSTRFFMSCNVKVLGSATCPFLVQK